MRIKFALVALAGFVIGSIVGATGVGLMVVDMTADMVGAAWRDGTLRSLDDTTNYLRLLEDGKTDALRKVLVGRLQSTTIGAAADLHDGHLHALRKVIEIGGRIEAVQADDSEIGKMAADARKRIIEAAQP